MVSFKEKVIARYTEAVANKINALQQQQEDLLESLKGETKSTAGDKYETSRAMLHLEQENIAAQLSVLLQQKALLAGISVNKNIPPGNIQFGHLVKTNKGFLFIVAALGKMLIEDQHVFAISSESPLGKLLMGKTVSQQVQVPAGSYTIEAIL